MIRKARAASRGSGRSGNGEPSSMLRAEITLDAKLL